jgi:predicted RNA binding protein YcfA (HicA-like mRNA interferase family)
VVDGFYKEIARIAGENGYRYLMNAKGSHEKWQHAETGKIILVPRNLKSRHTANAILKDMGVPKKF